MATGKCAQRGSVCFMKTKGWLPGQRPGAGVDLRPGAHEARCLPGALAQPGCPRSLAAAGSPRAARGPQVQCGFRPWSRMLGRRCTVDLSASGFLLSTEEVDCHGAQGRPGMLAHGLFGRLPLFASFPSRSREAKAFENF